MIRICGMCGRPYTRKIEHIKRNHKREAYKQFISLYYDKINKICQICKNIKPIRGRIEIHVLRKHLGRAAKEYAQTF